MLRLASGIAPLATSHDCDLPCMEMVTLAQCTVAILRDADLPSSRRVVYRMGMPALSHHWTVDMLDALPDDGQRYEIIDGELFVTPAPREVHQLIVGELHSRLSQYVKRAAVGRAMLSPSDVRRGDRKRNRVQPDVMILRLTEGQRPEYPYDLNDLMLSVEVVSPSNPMYDYQVKRDLYVRGGVQEYWVVDYDARNVSRWRGPDDPGDVLSEAVIWQPEGMPTPFVLDLAEFFADVIA